MDTKAELQLLKYIYDANVSTPYPSRLHLEYSVAAEIAGVGPDKVEAALRKFCLRNWIKRTPTLAGWDSESFFAVITDEGMREVEARPISVSIQGQVSVAIEGIGSLSLGEDDSRKIRLLLDSLAAAPDKDSKADRLKEILSFLSNATTSADGLLKFIPLIGAIAAQIV